MGTISVVILSVVSVLLGLLLISLTLRSTRQSRVAHRLNQYVQTESSYNVRESVLEIRQLEGSIKDRLIAPAIKVIGAFLGQLTPREAVANLNRQLSRAGNPFGMTAREFYGFRLIALLVFSSLAFFPIDLANSYTIFLSGLLVIAGYILPLVWLRSRVQARRSQVLRSLPDVLDMLSVCSKAGLGFEQSIQRVSEHYDNPLGEEFGRIILEMELGVTRADSLRNMADRLDVPELSSFVSILLQSDQLGMSIADTLSSQAEQMRILRRYRAQEIAQRIPAKMIFPLAFMILPALLAVILGPSLPVLIDLFATTR